MPAVLESLWDLFLRITELQVHLETLDQLVVHSANQSLRVLAGADGKLQIDRLDEVETKIGKRSTET